MPHNPQFRDPGTMPVDARAALCNGGTLAIFDGEQPLNAMMPAQGTLLVSVALPDPAFEAAAVNSSVATAVSEAIAPAVAVASGFPTWFRVAQAGGTSVFDGTVGGDTTFDLTITTPASAYIAAGVNVQIAQLALIGTVAQDVVATGSVTVPPDVPAPPPVSVPSGYTGAEPAYPGALEWMGHLWELEDWGNGNGQPKATQVAIDGNGYLQLTIADVAGQVNGAELDSVRGDMGIKDNPSRWGYGTYQWVVGTDLAAIDPALVLGLFTFWAYGSATTSPPNQFGKGGPVGQKEIDIEASNWQAEGNKTGTFFGLGYYQDDDTHVTSGIPENYGQQTHTMVSGSQVAVEAGHEVTTARFTWMPGYIQWDLWYGTDTTAAPSISLRMTEGEEYSYTSPFGGNVYTGTVSIPATGGQQVCMNLWSQNVSPPLPAPVTVILRSFTYTPSS